MTADLSINPILTPCKKCGGTKRYKHNECATCHGASSKAWREANPERVSTQQREWRANNRDRANGYTRKWHSAHSKECTASHHAWCLANPDKVKALNDKERKAEKLANPLRVKSRLAAGGANATARRYGQSLRITGKQVYQLWLDSHGICGICRHPVGELEWSLDHVTSFKAGGLNIIENCQISHFECNCAKGAWVNPVEH